MYVCMYVCIYTHIHTHTYIHTHTPRLHQASGGNLKKLSEWFAASVHPYTGRTPCHYPPILCQTGQNFHSFSGPKRDLWIFVRVCGSVFCCCALLVVFCPIALRLIVIWDLSPLVREGSLAAALPPLGKDCYFRRCGGGNV